MKKLFRKFFAAASVAILAVSMNACSGDDNVVVVKPAAPTGVAASNSPATIRWSPVTGATSYNIYYSTVPGVTLATGTEITGVTSPAVIPGLTPDTLYYFVVTAVNAGGESLASVEVSAINATFAQGDLNNKTWNVTVFQTGDGEPDGFGWLRMTIPLDDTGAVITDDPTLFYEDNGGATTWPGAPAAPGPLQFTIDPLENGIVQQVGFAGESSHNIMSSNKNLIIGTFSYSADTKQIRIFQKVDPAVVFDQAVDLNGKSFVFHQLASGATADGWRHGAGTISAAVGTEGLVTVTEFASDQTAVIVPPTLPEERDTLTLNTNGVVTSTDPNFLGYMSSDKKLIVGTTTTAEGNYELTVIQITDPQTFTMSDLAGYYNFSSLFGGASGYFQYGKLQISYLGDTIFSDVIDNNGPLVIAQPPTLGILPDGTITDADDSSFHGTMSSTKDLLVSTYTLDEDIGDSYGLSLAVK